MLRSTRRQFCAHAAVLGGAAASTVACRTHESHQPPAAPDAGTVAPSAPQTFTAVAFATLSAVCERILPRDDDPGAVDLGVPGYIDRMAATPELASVRDMLVRALPAFDKESRKRHAGKAFADATAAEQDEIIGSWQHGRDGSQHVFDVLVSLTLEGAFGDPKYGGNAGGRGFAIIGFKPDPPLVKMGPMPAMDHGMDHQDAPE